MDDAAPITPSTVTELLHQQHDSVKQMLGEMDGLTGSARVELFDCLRATLAMHETAEEMIVYPEVRDAGDDGARIVKARQHEEHEAKQVLADLEKIGANAGADFDELFAEFRTAVLQHASAEEAEVFPLLESHLTHEKLREMADSVIVVESVAPTHPHPHGPDSALGNILVGPFVAMVDKVRDRLAAHDSGR
jgi:hemerythrin superfamily protein